MEFDLISGLGHETVSITPVQWRVDQGIPGFAARDRISSTARFLHIDAYIMLLRSAPHANAASVLPMATSKLSAPLTSG